MYHRIGRVSCFVVFCATVFSVLVGGSCLRQPCHDPADPFASSPVSLPDNRSVYPPIQNAYQDRHQTTSIQQVTHSSLPVANNAVNTVPNLPVALPPTPKYEIQQLTSVSGAVQNNYHYNNTLNNSPNNSPNYYPKNPAPNSTNYPPNNSSYRPTNSSGEVLQVSLESPVEGLGGVGGGSGVVVDRSLNELGANVIAAAGDGKEVFSGSWRPSDNFGFWPQSEYLADGGDGDGRYGNAKVLVGSDWSVRNLDTGDTVAHYDTVDGRIEVEASNQVHIYAPRFGAVRKVEGVVNTDHLTSFSAINQQVRTNTNKSTENTGRTEQELAASYTRNRDDLVGVRARVVGAGVGSSQSLEGYNNFEGVMAYSDVLRLKKLGSAEIIHLAEGCQNAYEWQGAEGVKINASYRVPMSVSLGEGVGQLFKIDDSGVSNKSKLRLIKVASKKSAQPGDIIEFTLRFDNLGTEPLGNITVMDNLTTRLQFIPDSAKSSVPSGFVVESNGVSSFTLRFEITDPLEAGQFGVIQFRCRVL
ncbi:MAG: hypothetical protein LBL39_01115 [Planctomycetaceae bacterium]|jgi:uncharacterized repeat protein (TIGR01451 family)|nr:hypothetical protein [Planctomycetaceae bacterium]